MQLAPAPFAPNNAPSRCLPWQLLYGPGLRALARLQPLPWGKRSPLYASTTRPQNEDGRNPAPPRQPKNNQNGKSCGLKNPLPRSSQARAPPNMLRYARPGMDCVILRALLKSLKSLSVKLDEKERLQHDLTQA